jgi:hypothetical protein
MNDPSFGRLKPGGRDFVPQQVQQQQQQQQLFHHQQQQQQQQQQPITNNINDIQQIGMSSRNMNNPNSNNSGGGVMMTGSSGRSNPSSSNNVKEFKEFIPGRGVINNNETSSSSSNIREFIPGRGLIQQQQQHLLNQQQQQHQQQSYLTQQQQQQLQLQLHEQQQQQQLLLDPLLYADAMTLAGPLGMTNRMLPRTLETLPKRRTVNSALLPASLRTFYAAQARVMNSCLPPDANELKELPAHFHSVLPLDADPSVRNTAGSCGYPSAVYKAINGKDGFTYAIRRIDNVKSIQNLSQVMSMWNRVQHANVISLREAFTQNRALFLVHDFIPGAQTLREFITARNANGQPQLLPENVLWSIITQILSAVRAVHIQGLACRDLSPSRVLLTGRYRTRIASAGIVHSLEPTTSSLAEEQQEDILWVGQLVLMLATMSHNPTANFQMSVEFVQQRYSSELVAFTFHPFKLQHTNQRCNVYDLLALASQGLLAENDALYAHGDALEETVSRLFECDRLFRLMTKLSVITERPPEHGVKVSDSWSEVDERYVIKLFRDYVFHQTDDAGKPWLDVGHIIDCLNKLDIGSQETILLSSRDGRALLVVSFDDVRQSVEKAFQELLMMNPAHAFGNTSSNSSTNTSSTNMGNQSLASSGGR